MANPTLLDMPIARDGAKNSIPSTTSPTTGLLSQQYGWQDINSMPVQQGGKAPSRLDFNGVLNLLSNILFYCQKGWQFEWDSSQAYYAGCIVKDTSDGKMYQCLNDVTSTTAPHADTTNWKLWDLSMLANYLPLAGGTMTGNLIKRNVNDEMLALLGGTDDTSAQLNLWGNANTDFAGGFRLVGCKGDGDKYILQCDMKPSPTLKYGLYPNLYDLGNSAIVAKGVGSMSTYIKNASGLIICTGVALVSTAGTAITFPISFSSRAYVSVTNIDDKLTDFDNIIISPPTLTGFTAKAQNFDNYRIWTAIGY